MKQICPFCGAELAENARFCLYCMSPLTEKTVLTDRQPNRRRRWLLAIVPVALGLLVAGGVWLWKGGDPMAANVTPEKTASDASGAGRSDAAVTASVTASGQVGGQTTGREDPVGTSLPGRQSGTTGSLVSTKTSGRTGAASSAGTTRAAGSTFARGSSGLTTKAAAISTPTAASTTTRTKATTKATVASTTKAAAASGAVFQYRAAARGDDFNALYDPPDDAVVITGVAAAASDGVYVIPDKIDGKTVIAIMGLAFCGDRAGARVKEVVVPAGVRTIWENAFGNCYQMSDIYFCGNAIYTDPNAFADPSRRGATLTIHCSTSCSDRNFRYYRNCAAYYDARYEEWNGYE